MVEVRQLDQDWENEAGPGVLEACMSAQVVALVMREEGGGGVQAGEGNNGNGGGAEGEIEGEY